MSFTKRNGKLLDFWVVNVGGVWHFALEGATACRCEKHIPQASLSSVAPYAVLRGDPFCQDCLRGPYYCPGCEQACVCPACHDSDCPFLVEAVLT